MMARSPSLPSRHTNAPSRRIPLTAAPDDEYASRDSDAFVSAQVSNPSPTVARPAPAAASGAAPPVAGPRPAGGGCSPGRIRGTQPLYLRHPTHLYAVFRLVKQKTA